MANAMGLSMIRVKSCGKVPDEGKGWQQIEYRPYETISFTSGDNAGVITGKQSGIIVLDVDNEEIFSQACKANNWIVPETFTVRTGKGYHYYYQLPEGDKEYRNRSKKDEGWDIRANGGYVVAPGSIHPSGSVYTLANDRAFNMAPEWLLQRSLEVAVKSQANRRRSINGKVKSDLHSILPVVDLNTLELSSWVRQAITEGAEEGARSETVFSVIKALLEAGYEPDVIVAIFMAHLIGKKALEKDDPEGWVYDDIDRIKVKMADYEQIEPTPVELQGRRTIPIPNIEELKVEYRTLIEYSHRDLIETLHSYGNVTSESQEQALYTLLHTYAALAQGKIAGRLAAPLPTGLGKTTSISAFLGRAYSMGMLGRQKGNFTVAIAASKVDQLCDLHEALVAAGIPEKLISLIHSYTYNPDIERDADDRLPKGYAALPATPDKNRPILLLSHNKIKNGPEHAFDDSLQKRRFVIWDESMISTKTGALSVERLAHGFNSYEFVLSSLRDQAQTGGMEIDQVKLEVANSTLEYLHIAYRLIRNEISSQEYGQPKQVLRFPHANEMTMTEMLLAVEWVAQAQEVEEVRKLIHSLKELLRATQYDTSVHLGMKDKTTIVRFDVVVPDSMKNMIILDASARINTLMMLDETIHLPENLPELQLKYTGTIFHRIDHAAGRGATHKELENNEKNLLAGITEVIQRHPDEGILLFTHKYHEGKLNHREVIEKYLTDNGVDLHEMINGKPRFNWLTHGNETASNKYTHCSVAIFTGLMYKSREVSLGETVAQKRDHTASISEKLLTQVTRGMQSQAIHQGANRTASRTIVNDQAKPVNIYYTYHNDSLVPYLEVVLPGARFVTYESDVMSPRTMTWKVRKAVAEFLKNLAITVGRVSVKAINTAVPETIEVGSATCKRVINSIIEDSSIPWARSGRSLVRVKSAV